MDAAAAKSRAQDIAKNVLAKGAAAADKDAKFSREAISALGEAGLLGIIVPTAQGGLGLGPRAFFDVTEALAQVDASVAMVFTMHVCGTACLLSAPKSANVGKTLEAIAKGQHLTTLGFSERGSRSHFWAPISKATKSGNGVKITAQKSWVTSAGQADSYVMSALSPNAKGPTDSTLYLVPKGAGGLSTGPAWDGMGLRANSSSPMTLEGVEVADDMRVTEDGTGFKAMLEVVLPLFSIGSAAVALGICRATVGATVSHLKTSQFEHLGASLGEALPTLRNTLAGMQLDTDGLAARMDDVLKNVESPNDATMLRVLESKAAAGEAAIKVTTEAMRVCGGAAFSKHTSIDRYFRDAYAGAVMAPTVDVLKEFIGKALLGIPLF